MYPFRKPLIGGVVAALIVATAIVLLRPQLMTTPLLKLGPTPTPTVAPLLKYRISELENRTPAAGHIAIASKKEEDEVQEPPYRSRLFTFTSDGRRISGRLTLPAEPGTYPLIVMVRGYVPREIYYTGIGSERSANYLAEQGYITLAPDFLGYGESDPGPADGLEDRFATYTTLMDLLSTTDSLQGALDEAGLESTAVDLLRTGIWAHSNGGQIVLTVLAATKRPIPTVLWAPVSKPFPYSVLYYSDESEDDGYGLRRLIADFEDTYRAKDYSFTNYLDNIKAPIRIHQGTVDESIPVAWTQLITEKLTAAGVDVSTTYHDGENHNFTLGKWEETIAATDEFFQESFKNSVDPK